MRDAETVSEVGEERTGRQDDRGHEIAVLVIEVGHIRQAAALEQEAGIVASDNLLD